MKKSSKSEETKRLKKELERWSRKYNEIYYSKIWQSFLFIRQLIGEIKRIFSLVFSPSLRLADLPMILEKAKIDPKKLVVINLPLMNWKRKKQRPQQICEQFAKDKNFVFYINNHFIVENKKGLTKNQVAGKVEIRKLDKRIYQVSLVAFQDLIIVQEQVKNSWDKKYISWSIKALLKAIGSKKIIFKVDNPFWQTFVEDPKDFLIYDCMDDYSAFWRMDSIVKLEPLLVKKADVVLASSGTLYKKMRRLNKNSFLIENAADFSHFSQKIKDIPGDIKSIKKPIIGYYGAISDWFDEKLVDYLARQRPDWQFILIGNVSNPIKIESMKLIKNIHFLGEKSYKSLPAYLNLFDVCLIPFLKNSLTKAVSPIKFFEYLSAGKPVVVVDLPEMRKYQPYTYIAENKKDFLRKIEIALKENKTELKKKRQQFTRQNTWKIRYNKIRQIIQKMK